MVQVPEDSISFAMRGGRGSVRWMQEASTQKHLNLQKNEAGGGRVSNGGVLAGFDRGHVVAGEAPHQAVCAAWVGELRAGVNKDGIHAY